MAVVIQCRQCKAEFTKPPSQAGRGYCSLSCWRTVQVVPPITCRQCGVVTKVPRRGKNQPRVYCSKVCYLKNKRNSVSKLCPVCASDFTVPASNAHRYTVCSAKCRVRGSTAQDRACPRCGTAFRASLRRRYCSEACYRPPIMSTCRLCFKTFRVLPADTDRQFCNISCYRRFRGSTKLEDAVESLLNDLGVEYRKEVKIGRYSCDFLLPASRTIIEADGTYWHKDSVDRDSRRDTYLRGYGYAVLRLPEANINSLTPHQLQLLIAQAI